MSYKIQNKIKNEIIKLYSPEVLDFLSKLKIWAIEPIIDIYIFEKVIEDVFLNLMKSVVSQK